MNLKLTRKDFTDNSTIGDLYIDTEWFCYTLEDTLREPGEKVAGKTAIPAGVYRVVIDFSNRFQKNMPHILDVPGFEGIRIHAGNTAAHTEGCPLLGMTKAKDFIGKSKLAFEAFMPRLSEGLRTGKVLLTIENQEVV